MQTKPSFTLSLGLLLAAATGLAACTKTVEGETKRWERATQETRALVALYPGFKAPLEEQIAKANAAMDSAKAAPAADQPKKMNEANALLTSGWVGQLSGLDSDIKKLRSKCTEATTRARDETARLAAKQVVDDAQRIVVQVEERGRQGAADSAAAVAIVGKMKADLASASKNVERALKAQADAERAAKAAVAKPATAAGTAAAAQPAAGSVAGQPAAAQPAKPAVTTWKCSYCGATNEDTAKKCKGCGAPRG